VGGSGLGTRNSLRTPFCFDHIPDIIMNFKNVDSSIFIPVTNPQFAPHQQNWFAEMATNEQGKTRPLITEKRTTG
jgi:hypothetical protein